MSYPETHIIEIDQPKGMPLQIKGLFFRGRLKWMSLNIIDSEGQSSPCEVPDHYEDAVFESMKKLLCVTFVKSEELNRKRPWRKC
jgi:hypothetical protein